MPSTILNLTHLFLKYLKKQQHLTRGCLTHQEQQIHSNTSQMQINPLPLTVSLGGIVCYSNNFESISGMKRKFTKHEEEISCLASDQNYSRKRVCR